MLPKCSPGSSEFCHPLGTQVLPHGFQAAQKCLPSLWDFLDKCLKWTIQTVNFSTLKNRTHKGFHVYMLDSHSWKGPSKPGQEIGNVLLSLSKALSFWLTPRSLGWRSWTHSGLILSNCCYLRLSCCWNPAGETALAWRLFSQFHLSRAYLWNTGSVRYSLLSIKISKINDSQSLFTHNLEHTQPGKYKFI